MRTLQLTKALSAYPRAQLAAMHVIGGLYETMNGSPHVRPVAIDRQGP
jgi:hypothetical protein